MIEVEIKARTEGFDDIKKKLNEMGATLVKTVSQMDSVYGSKRFLDENNFIIEGGIVPRIRDMNGKKTIDFKEIVRSKSGFDLSIDVTDLNVARRFLEKLDFNEAFTIKKVRNEFKHGEFNICLDEVEQLGNFIEVERVIPSEDKAEETREEVLKLLNQIAPSAQIELRKYGDLMQEIINKEAE